MNDSDRATLQQFFGAYFHQDWDVEASTSDEVINEYVAAHPRSDERARVAGLIDAWAAECADADVLRHALFEDLGCYYDPGNGQLVRAWLRDIAEKLRRS